MSQSLSHDERMENMCFGTVYPLYLAKIQKKGRTEDELMEVICWLTGYSQSEIEQFVTVKVTFKALFDGAKLHPNASLITGMICGSRIEEIENPHTKNVRYLDKLVDELAKGKKMEKVLR
jgi:hypothetical protein